MSRRGTLLLFRLLSLSGSDAVPAEEIFVDMLGQLLHLKFEASSGIQNPLNKKYGLHDVY